MPDTPELPPEGERETFLTPRDILETPAYITANVKTKAAFYALCELSADYENGRIPFSALDAANAIGAVTKRVGRRAIADMIERGYISRTSPTRGRKPAEYLLHWFPLPDGSWPPTPYLDWQPTAGSREEKFLAVVMAYKAKKGGAA
jgi:hypothetical protein